MAGRLSAAMLAELRAPRPEVFPFLELYLPSPLTTNRYASGPVDSATLGYMAGKVVPGGWGQIRRAVSDRDNSLTLSDTSVTIEDTDRTFSAALATLQQTVRGARAVIILGSPNVAPASWFTCYDGFLDKWSMQSALVWTLKLHPNDRPLKTPVPKTPILPGDWPNVADKTLYGECVPIIYGTHDSRGSTDQGMVPCQYVDRIGGRFLVQHGWSKSVPRVYDNATGAFLLKTVTTDYVITHPTINGRLFTLIDYVTPPAVTVEVQADVDGCEATGDGSGALLTGADALKHFLVNFVFGDYQGGNWAAVGSVPISTTLFTAAQSFLTSMGWDKVSRRYGGGPLEQRPSAEVAINEWCRSLQLYAFPTSDGKIAVAPDDHRVTTLWYDFPRWVRYDLDEHGEDGSFSLDYDRDGLIDRLSVSYILDSVRGEYAQQLEVRDLASTEEAGDELALPWSNASLA